MSHSVEAALISAAVTIVSVLVLRAVASAGVRIFSSVSQGPARHDGGQVTEAVRTPRLQTAFEAAQRRLLTFGTSLFAAGAYAARNFTLSGRTLRVSGRGQMIDPYANAVEQLGSGQLDVRIGGVYALERVAHDSPEDHPAVMEVLVAFVREHSHAKPSPIAEDQQPARRHRRVTPPDVQAAITVIGRRRSRHDGQLVNLDHTDLIRANLRRADLIYADLSYADFTGADLTRADLTGADLTGADLTGVNFTHAHLTGAILRGADLTHANLTRANLGSEGLFGGVGQVGLFGADLTYANLTDACLKGADLTGAILASADLTGADLSGVILKGADLTRANLTRANLTSEDLFRGNLPGANLTGANLTGADLTGAGLAGANLTGAGLFDADLADADLTSTDLSGADLRGACWPPDAVTPAGWQRDAGSGRLRRTGTDSCDATAD
jgi:uncharacterized protein YjbI with pentapeptide repeats